MRITKIAVKGLFGMFDHEIPLNQESRITIVHGPNGVGKTVLMRMVDGLFNYEFQYLKKIPFNELCIELQEGAVANFKSYVKVVKSNDGNSFNIQYEDMSAKEYALLRPLDIEPELVDRAVRNELPHCSKLHWQERTFWVPDDHYWNLVSSDSPVVLADFQSLRAVFGGHHELYSSVYGRDTSWFQRICDEIVVDSLNVQRLLQRASLEDFADFSDEDLPAGRTLSALDTIDSHFYSIFGEELWHELPQETMALLEIINDRFLFKSATAGPEGDTDYHKLVFRTEDGTEVPFSELSSGEQNLLYLYFRLIFWHGPLGLSEDTPSLFLIDEPELSMNVVWQRNFLKDLQRIIELRKFDVLIATHSPQIIHDKWDWMVPLGEPVDD